MTCSETKLIIIMRVNKKMTHSPILAEGPEGPYQRVGTFLVFRINDVHIFVK